MDDFSMFVPNVHFEQIPIKNLVSNQMYQRNLSLTHVQRTAQNFNLYQVNPVKVSRRDGINYVFNGQHTIEIIAAVSGSRETPVWCMIYDDLNYEEEADIFANQQKFIKTLTPYEIFMGNIEAGNDTQLIIKDLVESYGLIISYKRIPCSICAISTLEYIFEKHGFHTLDRTLRLCVAAWEGDFNSLSGNMLKGVSRLIVAFGDKIRDDTFKERLSNYTPKEISKTARERKSGSLGYAEAMLLIYNKKTRTPLRWSRLYSARSVERDVIDGSDNDDAEIEDIDIDDTMEYEDSFRDDNESDTESLF